MYQISAHTNKNTEAHKKGKTVKRELISIPLVIVNTNILLVIIDCKGIALKKYWWSHYCGFYRHGQ